MKYDSFDYFTVGIDHGEPGAISVETARGPGKSRISVHENTVTIEVDYAHRPVFVIRREGGITLTNRQRDVIAATRGLRPDLGLLERFVRRGRALVSCVPFHGVDCVVPSHRITVAGGEVSTERYQTTPPGTPLTGSAAVEEAIVAALAARIEGRNCAFALSGGTDSTLLTALAKRHQLCEVTAYTAKTGAGRDLAFARAAAESLGIRLIEVEIPFTRRQLELHRAVTRAACGPVLPKAGFAMICEAAAADGFDGIVEGTGPAPIFGGNDKTHGVYWAAEQLRLGHRERVETFTGFALAHGLIRKPALARIEKLAREEHPFRDYMFERLVTGRVYQHNRVAAAEMAGIEVVMPFFDHDVGRYLLNGGEAFFEGGRNKSALRKILANYVPAEIAGRTDNQGLRWPTKWLIRELGREMRRTIAGSGIAPMLGVAEKLKIALGYDRDFVTRCYAAAVFLETRAEDR
jgi:asparagine synthetase B (glutamine-hydrolysing)